MSDKKEFQNLPGKEHLKKDFGAELNYKLWITKGARFNAANRLKIKSTLSVYCIGFLTGYIIIINLFTFLPVSSSLQFSPTVLTITTVGLSILVLVFSLVENLKNYSLESEKIHSCAMEIGKLYNEWRYYKTLAHEKVDLVDKVLDLTQRYEIILDKYGNHENIDTHLFKVRHNYYFDFSKPYVLLAYINHYLKVYFIYHFLIFIPVVAFLIFVIANTF